MQKLAGHTHAFVFTLLLAAFPLGACDGEERDEAPIGAPGDVREEDPSEAALTVSSCATFAKRGVVEICHATGASEGPQRVSIPTETCQTAHVGHTDDFLPDQTSGCVQAKSCKRAGLPCQPAKAAKCCSLSCLCIGEKNKCVCG
jgi:hypothetical protein